MLKTVPIHVHYPLADGQMVLRTDADWDRDVAVTAVTHTTQFTFHVTSDKPFVYFKPGLRRGQDFFWSVGANYLLIMDSEEEKHTYPTFFASEHGSLTERAEITSRYFKEAHKYRLWLPPGYAENTLKQYPVIYMHDGNNLFLPEESALGETWQVETTIELMDSLRTMREVIVVGVWPIDRMNSYTRPGYQKYGKFLVEELKPFVDRHYRTLPGPQNCAVMGSSLGGVVSFYLAWEYPQVYGMAACMSSTFGYKDDLRERVTAEPKRNVKFYLDSGVPGDNYEVTKDMAELLRRQGYKHGEEMLYFSFPADLHNEKFWALRSHLPYQFFFENQ
jgi:predicted alpha/beta superfamily hydrolase